MMNVTIIGTGYVGLTTGVALAYLGHRVTAVDNDPRKLALLQAGACPIHEPGLETLLAQVAPNLIFTADTRQAVAQAEVVLIAVGTPSTANGEADLSYIEAAAREVARAIRPGQTCTFVVKSTVPAGVNRQLAQLVEDELTRRGITAQLAFAFNPEFLREGVALRDTFYPDRVVIGAEQPEAVDTLAHLYRPLLEQTFTPPALFPRPDGFALPHLITTDIASAEIIKYAANAFLALKISFINEVAGLCELTNADIREVARGIGSDPRIGNRFLTAGLGWGGSCFPKDTAALLAMAEAHRYTMPIIAAARAVNQRQRSWPVDKLQEVLGDLRGRTVGVLGLAFKPNTDDVRDAPALDIIRALLALGAQVQAHDPVAMPNARQLLAHPALRFVDAPYAVADGADAVVLATEWEEYALLHLERLAEKMTNRLLIDGRNLFMPDIARAAGFHYLGIGRQTGTEVLAIPREEN